jgi:hypothetical protein
VITIAGPLHVITDAGSVIDTVGTITNPVDSILVDRAGDDLYTPTRNGRPMLAVDPGPLDAWELIDTLERIEAALDDLA